MSEKLASLGLFKITLFSGKFYDVILWSMMSPIKFCHVTQII